MSSQTMTHQRNMESSLLFLQQEHANTLKALHDEISKLQKKCSELTFEMAMVTPDTDKDDYGRIKRLESDLEVQKKENKELQQDSEKKDKRMKMLEQQLRAQEKKFQDELKAKNVTINTLKRELDSKSNNIAFLTTEMHRIKKRVTDGDQNVSDKVIPTPPRDGAPRPRRSAQKRVELGSTNIHGAVVTRRPLRGTSGRNRGVARPESPAEIPDPAPFLQRNMIAKKEVMIKPTPPPLPPISAHAIDSVRNNGGPVVFRSARADTRTVPTRLQAGAPSPEVETLAVDQVPGTSATGKWGRAHESKSTEYN